MGGGGPLNEYFYTGGPDECCHIMWHFIRVSTVCKGKKDLQTNKYNIF